MAFSEKEVGELSRKIFGRLANVYEFYALYRALPHTPGDTSANILDQWILTRFRQVSAEVTDGLERYALDEAARPFGLFVDDLSTWYLRRSRDRIKDGDTEALATLAFILRETARLLAPFTPFFADWLWRELGAAGDAESVHLAPWGLFAGLTDADREVLSQMQEVRNVVSLALEQRATAKLPVRQPLSRLALVSGGNAFSQALLELIKDEVNVKDVARIAGLPEGFAVELDTTITSELREEGMVREARRFIQEARKLKGVQSVDVVAKVTLRAPVDVISALERSRGELESAARTKLLVIEPQDILGFGAEIDL